MNIPCSEIRGTCSARFAYLRDGTDRIERAADDHGEEADESDHVDVQVSPRRVRTSFVLLRQTRAVAQNPAGSLLLTAVIPFCRGVDERSESHFEHCVELVVGEVGVVDDPFRDEWSLDDVHGQLDVGCGR